MEKKTASGMMLALLLTSMLTLASNIQSVKAEGTIYIRADGSVDPSTAPIQRDGDLYTLTGNITSDADGIVIERNNMSLDGVGYTIQGTGAFLSMGIYLIDTLNVTIKNTEINAFGSGISLHNSSNNSISGNKITNTTSSIDLRRSSNNNVISRNYIVNCSIIGVIIFDSNNNRISQNNMTGVKDGQFFGISAMNASGNYIYRNRIERDVMEGIDLRGSNSNVVAENFILPARTGRGGAGIWIIESSNNVISENFISGGDSGRGTLYLDLSHDNVIEGNTVMDSKTNDAIHLLSSRGNRISRNYIANNSGGGIAFATNSDGNTLSDNNLSNNTFGVRVYVSGGNGNTIYHNNLINNTAQVRTYNSVNIWDDGYPSGGNYWSDYFGVDLKSGPYKNESGSDGIGDMPYTIDANNTDRYPLTEVTTVFDAGTWNKVSYSISIETNSTVSGFYFNPSNRPLICFNVTGPDDTVGFCRVIVPKELMWCNTIQEWNVTVNGSPPKYLKVFEDVEYTYLVFTYRHTTQRVAIASTHAIAEASPPFWTQWWFWIMVIVIAWIAIFAGTFYFLKKKKPPTPTDSTLPPEGTL